VIGQQRDLIRDSADDIGASQYPHSVGHGIREAVTETLAQLADRFANLGIGRIAVLQHGAERGRPRATARAERLKLAMAERPAVLDRVGADRRQP
jgi:hypothetical protein